MSPDITRFRVGFGTQNWDLLKIRSSKKGDTYIIFPIPGKGLHISFHASGETHLRGGYHHESGIYEIDHPIDFNLSIIEDDPEGTAEEFLDDIFIEPPEDEEILAFPASQIAFLAGITSWPDEDITFKPVKFLGDMLGSCRLISASELITRTSEADAESIMMGLDLDNGDVLIPFPADSFRKSGAISAERLFGGKGNSRIAKGFMNPMIDAITKAIDIAGPNIPPIESRTGIDSEIEREFNEIFANKKILQNLEFIRRF